MLKTFIKITTIAIISIPLSLSANKVESKVTIGTGGLSGVYYTAGSSICRLVNKSTNIHGVDCKVETGGSITNINNIKAEENEMGIAQSDWQYHAYNGTSKFQKQGAFKELRTIFSIHPEPFTLVVRKDSGIKTLKDLVGKRINIGNPGSGQRGTMEVLMKAMGWTKKTFKLVSELKSDEQSKALCDNKIDAMVFTVGHPSGSIKEATTTCESILINVTGKEVDALISSNPYYSRKTILGGMYKGNDTNITTFGISATLITSTKTSTHDVYTIVKSVFENFDTFKKLHPAFNHLTKETMIKNDLYAPLHDGAKKYYKEVGLLK